MSKKKARIGSLTSEGKAFATDFISYMNDACTAFHAVEAGKKILDGAGFTQILETESWNLVPNGKYYFTRNSTSLVAFTVGGAYQPGNGFTVLAAHSDSPCLKIKAVTCSNKGDALVLNTQPYGGGLWHTWFDRDLGLAGRVIYRSKPTKGETQLRSQLVCIDRPIARIPNLAIHLTTGKERDSFEPNLHEHAKAILAMDPSTLSSATDSVKTDCTDRLHPLLLQLVAAALQREKKDLEEEDEEVTVEDIVDLELQLIDVQPACFGGAAEEFIYSGRLDNLCSSYQILRAFTDGAQDVHDPLPQQTNVRMMVMFDHEEIGSASCQGAGSSMFVDTLRLISDALTDKSHGVFMRALRKSLIVSIDMAHAHHPNYAAKHDPAMAPKINGGLVIKHNANQRYATNAISATMFREFARLAGGLSVQEFAVRADSGCGSTIGPILATLSGILTVDVGTPQFSMHSIREMMGSEDIFTGYKHLKSALRHHPGLASGMSNA